eukprot:7222662-Alexandrium_andersonii.AAC.1
MIARPIALVRSQSHNRVLTCMAGPNDQLTGRRTHKTAKFARLDGGYLAVRGVRNNEPIPANFRGGLALRVPLAVDAPGLHGWGGVG